jgi:hypothetical protein
MWTVVYHRPNGDEVTLMKSSEATARQDFADKVKEAPAEGYSYVRLHCDGALIEGWP